MGVLDAVSMLGLLLSVQNLVPGCEARCVVVIQLIAETVFVVLEGLCVT